MKQNLKIFLVALIIGIISSYYCCTKLDTTIFANALNAHVTYFYLGSYNNLEEANAKLNLVPNSFIYNENGIYKIIIGAYTKEETKELMTSYFKDKNLNFEVKDLKVNNNYLQESENYELLINSSNKSYYEELNNSLLKLFNEYLN